MCWEMRLWGYFKRTGEDRPFTSITWPTDIAESWSYHISFSLSLLRPIQRPISTIVPGGVEMQFQNSWKFQKCCYGWEIDTTDCLEINPHAVRLFNCSCRHSKQVYLLTVLTIILAEGLRYSHGLLNWDRWNRFRRSIWCPGSITASPIKCVFWRFFDCWNHI